MSRLDNRRLDDDARGWALRLGILSLRLIAAAEELESVAEDALDRLEIEHCIEEARECEEMAQAILASGEVSLSRWFAPDRDASVAA